VSHLVHGQCRIAHGARSLLKVRRQLYGFRPARQSTASCAPCHGADSFHPPSGAAGELSAYNYLGFACTGARQSGAMTFPADELYTPLTPGNDELRLMLDHTHQVQAVAPFTLR
jgi:hypothetical protein